MEVGVKAFNSISSEQVDIVVFLVQELANFTVAPNRYNVSTDETFEIQMMVRLFAFFQLYTQAQTRNFEPGCEK